MGSMDKGSLQRDYEPEAQFARVRNNVSCLSQGLLGVIQMDSKGKTLAGW